MNTKNNEQDSSDYYIDTLGRLIYTSAFHLRRGECCFQGCLHCPYGTTVEKYGFVSQYDSNGLITFSLKGNACAKYDENSNSWTIYPNFENQNLEADLKTALNIFYKDKGER